MLIISVSGARGIAGQSMTPGIARAFARACAEGVPVPRHFCLGRDTRASSPEIASAAAAGLSDAGCVVRDLGVVATPTVAVMIDHTRASGGLMITASHNPPQWNGIKCLTERGTAPEPSEVEAIVRRFEELPRTEDTSEPCQSEPGGNETHVARVLEQVDAEAIRAAAPAVVLDACNGAGAVAGRLLLETLGCRLTMLHEEATGRFERGPEPTAEHLETLCKRVPECAAAVGFALDPDADRVALVDERGRCVGEEYTLVLAARRRFELRGAGAVVTNLSSSRMIDDLAQRFGANVTRTPVGEAHVAAAMRRLGAVIGGEGNGGVILPEVCYVRDSLSAMGLVLSLLAAARAPLGALVDELPRYEMIKQKHDLAQLGGREAVEGLLTRVAAAFTDERLETSDGVRVDFEDGWVHLRPSNTEPIVRLIAEAPTRADAETLAGRVAEAASL
jgi:phosphomannomutase